MTKILYTILIAFLTSAIISYWAGFGYNTFVAAATNGNILSSTDNGYSWDNTTSSTTNQLRGVGSYEELIKSKQNFSTQWIVLSSSILLRPIKNLIEL